MLQYQLQAYTWGGLSVKNGASVAEWLTSLTSNQSPLTTVG
jgi:hypothetical protein